MFQAVERGEMTTDMVSRYRWIYLLVSTDWLSVPTIAGRDPFHQHRCHIRSICVRIDQYRADTELPEASIRGGESHRKRRDEDRRVCQKRRHVPSQDLPRDSP